MMTFQDIVAIFSGGIIGALMGALGGGGSLIAIPLLVYVVGVPVQSATAMSLVVVGYAALFGAWKDSRYGRVRGLVSAVFSSTGVIGAWVGARGHGMVHEDIVLLCFGLLMMGMSLGLWKRQGTEPESQGKASCAKHFSRRCVAQALGIGFGVGLLTGFFGVGGGFVIVPTLIVVMGFPVRVAMSTSFLIIAMNAGSGILSHLNFGEIDRSLTALVAMGSIGGMILGGYVAKGVSDEWLTKAFSVLAGGIGIGVVVDNAIRIIG